MTELGGSYTLTLQVSGGGEGTTAALAVTAPSGNASAPTPTGGPTSWSATVTVDEAGWWLAAWTVSGPGATVRSARFYVRPEPTPFGVWPPSLADLRLDMGDRDDQSDESDDKLAMTLEAAIAKVTDLIGHRWDLGTEESGEELPPPTPDVILGTLRLAARWHTRRTTFDNMVQVGDGAGSAVPMFDADIDRMLGIGRYSPPEEMFA